MKKTLNILITIFSVFLIIFSLLFIVIEGRLLFSKDWIVYDNAFNGFVRYLLRLFLSILVFALSIAEIINIKKQNENLFYYLIYIDFGLVIMSILTYIYTTNYVSVVCSVFLSIVTLLKLYYYILIYKK